jgi:hypothetical protein
MIFTASAVATVRMMTRARRSLEDGGVPILAPSWGIFPFNCLPQTPSMAWLDC